MGQKHQRRTTPYDKKPAVTSPVRAKASRLSTAIINGITFDQAYAPQSCKGGHDVHRALPYVDAQALSGLITNI